MSVMLALALAGQAVPAAVIADPPRDAAHPARNEQLLIPSGGVGMNALIMHASGAGPKPTVVLLHGLPGNERNLDLAQAIRRAGWSVVTFSYRGVFGSPGSFSRRNAAKDVDAAMAFLRSPEVAARFAIASDRVVLGGHSMGGLLAVLHARRHPDLAGLMLLDPSNAGKTAASARAAGTPAAVLAKRYNDLGNILVGATAESLAEETLAAPADWDIRVDVAALKPIPLLAIGASEAFGPDTGEFAAVVRAAGHERVTAATMTTDHGFADHRIALAASIVRWLQALPK
jgi:pimeloyl-ACP methyl ester carboxylesterase